MDAVDDLGDAIAATRNFLTPVRAGLWLRLAILALFVGGLGTGFPSAPTGDVGPAAEQAPGPGAEAIPEEAILAAVVAVGFLLLLWLGYALVAAVMEFVLIESLRSETVRVRRYSNANVGRGIRLFGFRVALIAIAALVGATPVVASILGLGGIDGTTGVVGLAALFAVAVYLAYAVINRFTSEFVAPIMLLEERGVLSAWRRFWPTVRANWLEYVVYLVLVWIIQAAVGIAVSILMLIAGIIVAIPFIVIAVLLFALGDVGAILAAVVVLTGILAFVLAALLIQVPVVSYFKYYALLLLGDTNADLDLIPDQRAAIRADGGELSEPDWDDSSRPPETDDRGDDEDDWTADYGWVDDDEEIDDWEDAGWGDAEDRDGRDDRDNRDDRDGRNDRENHEDDDRGW
ncbi:hypothetical protein C491_02465 [Natronococcus amylolyticus DSM 10524]|uniref:Glycerophosphoryl diester phosphodiesterase membrane domain-containing protein n=1 Tax=Natronococcus amylolyticus DSM 10524 TaxID=1227497 RepID=L9XET7_9EURY|nr:hypothetical protein [Natronococcus amylolyticus]ELY60127.1 hypothetical protein C491_02465 [Natronococcus amylolyticus DSM 10524]